MQADQQNAVNHEASLSQALHTIESRFYISGSVKQPVSLTVNGSTAAFPMSLNDAVQQLAALRQHAKPSAFGRNNQTVLDPSVRVAQELAAGEFAVDFDPATAGILEKVRMSLVPEARSVRAELYKLNYMGAGGFFKPHKDTPRGGDTCFGTLVVTLPVPFSGGGLALRHGDKTVKLEWARAMWPTYGFYASYGPGGQTAEQKKQVHVPADAGLQWGAFFGDVEHEVQQVTEGHRITLTYTLHRDAAPDPTADVLLLRASQLQAKLAAALADNAFMPQGGTIAINCRHLYEETALAQSEAKLAQGGTKAYAAQLKLKNEDAVIAAVLAAAGLEVKCLRLLKSEYEDDYVLHKMPTKRDAAGFGHTERIENAFKATGVSQDDIQEFARGTVEEVVGGNVTWLGEHKAASSKWVERWYSQTGYFGNEACTTMFYTAAAIVATIPPANDNKRAAAADKASKALTAEVVHPDIASNTATAGRRGAGNTAAAAGRGGAGGSGAGGSRQRKSGGGASAADAISLDSSDDDGCDDVSDSGDQDDSGGSTDEEGDWRPPKKHKGASTAAAAAAGAGKKKKAATGSSRAAAPAAAAAAAAGGGAAAAAAGVGAAAPPLLFRPKDPSKMTAAERRAAVLDAPRKIHVTGGQGGRTKSNGGNCTLTLPPGAGLKELKAALRKHFGKVSHSKMGPLILLDEHGTELGTAKATDLVDGARVKCTYTHAPGNPGNLFGGGFGFGRRRFGFGFF